MVTRNSICQRIEFLTHEASLKGSRAIAFHECSVTGYSFARHLSKEQMTDLAEFVPEGPSVKRLTEIASGTIYMFLPDFLKKTVTENYTRPMFALVKMVLLPNTGSCIHSLIPA